MTTPSLSQLPLVWLQFCAAPYTCQQCGVEGEHLATRGLGCRRSEGCHHCYAAINGILYHALSIAGIPSWLEPLGLHTARWGNHGPMETQALGCNMSEYLGTVLHCIIVWSSAVPVQLLLQQKRKSWPTQKFGSWPFLHFTCHRDLVGLWT